MIAGSLPHGLGGLLARFEGDNDGTVLVEETRSPQLADHVVVAASHSGLLFSAEAIPQTVEFLGTGRFRHSHPPRYRGEPPPRPRRRLPVTSPAPHAAQGFPTGPRPLTPRPTKRLPPQARHKHPPNHHQHPTHNPTNA